MWEIHKILFGIDWKVQDPAKRFGLSRPVLEAVEQAIAFAASAQAELTFTSVLDCVDESSELWCERAVDERIRPQLDKRLLELAEYAEQQGAEVRASVCYGKPVWLELVREVLRERYDLVVLGPRRRVPNRPLGNVALKVIRTSPCTVWVPVPPASPPDLFVLACSDLSELSQDLLHACVYFGQLTDSKTHVLHVYQPEHFGLSGTSALQTDETSNVQTTETDDLNLQTTDTDETNSDEKSSGQHAASTSGRQVKRSARQENVFSPEQSQQSSSGSVSSSENNEQQNHDNEHEQPQLQEQLLFKEQTQEQGQAPQLAQEEGQGPNNEEELRQQIEDALYTQISATDYRTLTYGLLPHVVPGIPDEVILKSIKELSIDLLMIGAGGDYEVLGQLGSTSEVVLPQVNCGVLVFRPPDSRTPVTL